MPTETPTRARLPWQAVVAATVLAALAALLVILVLGGDGGDDDATTRTDSTLELVPLDGADLEEPLAASVTWPDDGEERPLGDDIVGPTVVNFFASWCTPCIKEMPDFEQVFQQLGGSVDFVGVAVNDRTVDARRTVEQTGVTYRWARDARGDVSNAARITQMPATMFVAADGQVVSVHSGALDADQLLGLIESELGVTP
jgi:thiol-disulfide isomerase/thioredoxin